MWVVLNRVWEAGGGKPSPQEIVLLHKMLCTISGGLGPWIKYPWEAPRTFVPLLVLYSNKVFSQGESTRLGSIIEASFLLFPQGDMVNYDEIKRFIRQEIIKMFDGNWQLAGRQWVLLALPSWFSALPWPPFP